MGERRREAFRVGFDRTVNLEFRGAHVTSDAGLLAFRELDDALGLTQQAGESLVDTRTGQNTRHGLIAQLRQSVYSRLADYEDRNDAEQLSSDPAMRYVVGDRARSSTVASASQMGRFETEILTQGGTAILVPRDWRSALQALKQQPGRWIDQVRRRRPVKAAILDLDSSVSETYGRQEGSAYNSHFGCTCYRPLFCFNQHGDLEGASLRNGNVHTADDWRSVLEPVLGRYAGRGMNIFFRGDAGFAAPDIYEELEAASVGYAIRVKDNPVLERHIEHLLVRPEFGNDGRPDVRYHDFEYQAASWRKPRRIVAKVSRFPQSLLPALGFIVTNLNWAPRRVTHFYNQRGTAEQWIKEGKYAFGMSGASRQRSAAGRGFPAVAS